MVIRYDSKLEVVYPDGQLVFTSSPKRSSFSVSSGLLSWHRYKVILEYCFAGKFSFFVLSLRKASSSDVSWIWHGNSHSGCASGERLEPSALARPPTDASPY